MDVPPSSSPTYSVLCRPQKGPGTLADAPSFLALAPMDGVTDHVFRTLVTELHQNRSGIDLCVSEFVRVTEQRIPDFVFFRHCPEIQHGGRTPSGTPVFVQLLGGDPKAMADAAVRATALGAIGIDLNFGCPAKTVNRHDGGATLLKTPLRIETVTRAVRDAVAPHIPVTAKIRLGWSDANDVEQLARAAERGGAAWLTIHARTRTQLYRPPVDWRSIRRACTSVNMPVVANGDIVDPTSFRQCLDESGCASMMIGRGVMADPSLFLRLRGETPPVWTLLELAGLLRVYGERMYAAKAERVHPLGRVKQWLRMAAEFRPELLPAFDHFKTIAQWHLALACLADWENGKKLPQT